MSYSLPYFAMKNKDVAVTKIVAYDSPERLLLLKYKDSTEQIDIVNLNEDFIKTKFIYLLILPEHIMMKFGDSFINQWIILKKKHIL